MIAHLLYTIKSRIINIIFVCKMIPPNRILKVLNIEDFSDFFLRKNFLKSFQFTVFVVIIYLISSFDFVSVALYKV